jgi:outer membrane protein assembly factor BamB
MKPLAVAAFVAVLCSPLAFAEEWSRFRGPNGTGVSTARGLPADLDPANAAWKTPLPPGHSSPVLTANRIFLTAHDGESLQVIGLDRKTGALLWKREVPRNQKGRLQNVNGPASPSTVTDGRNVYAFFQDFGLISFDADGKERWKMPLGPFQIFYGFGASPILVDDTLILPVDQDLGAYLLAVDKDSGKLRWKVDRPEVISGYSTPTVIQPKGGPKQVIVPESFQLSSYAVADGHRVFWVRGLACEMKSVASYDGVNIYVNGWGFPQNQPGQQIPTLTLEEALAKYDKDKDGKIAKSELEGIDKSSPDKMGRMLSAAFEAFDLDRDLKLDAKEWGIFRSMMSAENGLLAIKVGGQGDTTSEAIRWRYQRPVPQVPSTLLYDGVLYMVNDSGILISFDPATGNVLKQGRLKGAIDKYFASPVGGDGKVYLVSQDGTVSVVQAKGEWDVLGVYAMGDEVFATPAIGDDGSVYVRTRSALYCFATKGGKS